MKTYEIKQLIRNHLSEFWKVGQLNTRFEVAGYLVAYYGSISEAYIDAIELLAQEGYIKE